MMPAMSDWNFMAVIILVGLFALWKLEFAATLLNLKAFPTAVPKGFEDVMDTEKLDQARDYLRAHAKFGIIQSTVSLAVMVVFWSLGGFGWLDDWARSLGYPEVVTGLVFLTTLLVGQSLIGLPFSIYDTFVIEEKFGFNRSTFATFVMDRVGSLFPLYSPFDPALQLTLGWSQIVGALLGLSIVVALAREATEARRTVLSASAVLNERLAEREAELQQVHLREQESQRRAVLLEERQRIVRDMHDGIGSHLMSTLALAVGTNCNIVSLGNVCRWLAEQAKAEADRADGQAGS